MQQTTQHSNFVINSAIDASIIEPAPAAVRKICIINYKGGTGKTCTVVNLAHALAMKGKKVLIIDTDPQGSSGYHLGIDSSHTLYDLLVGNVGYKDCIVRARDNLDIITANERLFPAEMALSKMKNREMILHQRLSGLNKYYDFILVDCAPSINLLNQNSLTFSEEVYLPVSMEYLSLVGIKQLLNNIKIINKIFKRNLTIQKIIPTFYDRRNTKSEKVMTSLRRVFEPIISSPVRANVALSESAGVRQTIFEYAPQSKGAEDYNKLAEEVLNG
ncbi:ParA family protein [bacterium]|jgi:chromosome partitioning protein|nr:ParA family protein [bacterium]